LPTMQTAEKREKMAMNHCSKWGYLSVMGCMKMSNYRQKYDLVQWPFSTFCSVHAMETHLTRHQGFVICSPLTAVLLWFWSSCWQGDWCFCCSHCNCGTFDKWSWTDKCSWPHSL
jgi:hypothetical protein